VPESGRRNTRLPDTVWHPAAAPAHGAERSAGTRSVPIEGRRRCLIPSARGLALSPSADVLLEAAKAR